MCVAVASRNHDVLENLAFNITTPGHSMHRRYLSYGEAHGLLANPAATAHVLAWVASEPGLKAVDTHPHGRMAHLTSNVSTWERVSAQPSESSPRKLRACQLHYCAAPATARGGGRGVPRATADVGLPSLIRNDMRALHFATELPLGNRLQPIYFGWARNALVRRANSKLLRGLRRGAASRSLEVEITGSFSIVRAFPCSKFPWVSLLGG
jgi:hypothetical protein